MEHILIHCREPATRLAWQFARSLWPHENPQWPEVSIGIILACSSISAAAEPPRANDAPGHPTWKGAIRLLQILISETAHLIWVLRCEQVIQEKIHCAREIKSRWVAAINKRLTEDRIIATRVKKDEKHLKRLRVRSRENLSHAASPKKKNEVVCDNVRPRHCLQWKSQKEIVAGDRGRPTNKKK